MSKLKVYKKQFDYYKNLTEKSIDQLEEEDLFKVLKEGTNSIAVIMKHISGNMLSRWTNIFEEDGEKEWRNRDNEFVDSFQDKTELMSFWNKGWSVLYATMDQLKKNDLDRIIYIRNMGCTVHDALIRQLCHYPYHIGQIVFLAKVFKGVEFKSLSIPIGASEKYNAKRFVKEKAMKHFTDDIESKK